MNYMTSAAIITAVKIESDSVMRLYDAWEKIIIPADTQEYFAAPFFQNGQHHTVITAQQNTMGMTAAALLSAKIIHNFRPEYLIMCGIAAGIGQDPEYLYGDILIPDVVWDYTSGKFTAPEEPAIIFGNLGFQPRPISIATDTSILSAVRAIQESTDYTIHIGPMACGSAVVANKTIIEKQIQSVIPDTIGLDMESYGVCYAAENAPLPKPKALVIKSICDYADSEKSDKYQKFAAHNSSLFTKELIEKYLAFTL
ncbi:MAG: hypothetical protein IJG37_11080 [Synergistaceae bacterium]|nr:hypothetical protein [Synergistaceae bacterium]